MNSSHLTDVYHSSVQMVCLLCSGALTVKRRGSDVVSVQTFSPGHTHHGVRVWRLFEIQVSSLAQVVMVRRTQMVFTFRQAYWIVESPHALVSNFAFSPGTFFVAEMKEEKKKSLVNKLDPVDCIRTLHSIQQQQSTHLYKEVIAHS